MNKITPVPAGTSIYDPDDPVLRAFYNRWLITRIVTTKGESKNNNSCRPASILLLGTHLVLTVNDQYSNFFTGDDRIVTIIDASPNQMLWAYKRDAHTNAIGEPTFDKCHWRTHNNNKKITDIHTLNQRLTETSDCRHSLFRSTTSGHLSDIGYLPGITKPHTTLPYPEIIFKNYHFDRMHKGYILDFTREISFQRLAAVVTGILKIEESKTDEPFSRPIYCFDSHQGILSCQRRISKEKLVKMRENALVLSQYEQLTGLTSHLYRLLSQSGNDRFFNLLLNLPDEVKHLTLNNPLNAHIEKLKSTIEENNSSDFLTVLDAINSETLAEHGGLPKHLLDILINNRVLEDDSVYLQDKNHIFDDRSTSELERLIDSTFRHQNTIGRKLLESGIHVPIIESELFYTNPMVACLLIANGTRLCFGSYSIVSEFRGCEKKIDRRIYYGLYGAHYFYTKELLNDEELKTIQRGIIWDITCNENYYRPYTDTPITCFHLLVECLQNSLSENLSMDDPVNDANDEYVDDNLGNHFHNLLSGDRDDEVYLFEHLSKFLSADELALFDYRMHHYPHASKNMLHPDKYHRVVEECKKLVGEKLFKDFYQYQKLCNELKSSDELKQELENSLPKRRFTDEQMISFLNSLNSLPADSREIRIGQVYYRNRPNKTVTAVNSNHTRWIANLLATPPDFHSAEFQADAMRYGRYQAITQTAARHYYIYPHPNQAINILTTGTKPYYRKYHGLDHALRTQLATEFILQLLPDYSHEYKTLFKKYPDLEELLPIAELYHDAVAEDEKKIHEEWRAAEIFERDMKAVGGFFDEQIVLVASALKNKNTNDLETELETSTHPSRLTLIAPDEDQIITFTSDQQCSREELLLRQVLRFGDTVDILRVKEPADNFPEISYNIQPFAGREKFDPSRIELLAFINNEDFNQAIKTALCTLRDLACLTGGWHHSSTNPALQHYGLPDRDNGNHNRRLSIEEAPYPHQRMHLVLDDIIRFSIGKKAGITPCDADHTIRDPDNLSCWDEHTGTGGVYRNLHSEEQLRQICVPEGMTLKEKILYPYSSRCEQLSDTSTSCSSPKKANLDSHGPAAVHNSAELTLATMNAIEQEISRLQQEGILPAIGTPYQKDLQEIANNPHCKGAKILASKGLSVEECEHENRKYYRLIKAPRFGETHEI